MQGEKSSALEIGEYNSLFKIDETLRSHYVFYSLKWLLSVLLRPNEAIMANGLTHPNLLESAPTRGRQVDPF